MRRFALACALAASVVVVASAPAQDVPSVSAKAAASDPGNAVLPVLTFSPTPQDVRDYDKFFYFHREGTTFEQALTDVRECDALASGISFVFPDPINGANTLGAFLSDAVNGSAERRKIRRINLRNCMGFKEYKRYGLPRDIWVKFNFEEGNGRKEEDRRDAAMIVQARIASGLVPQQQALGL